MDNFDNNVYKLQKEIVDISQNLNKFKAKNHKTISKILNNLNILVETENKNRKQNLNKNQQNDGIKTNSDVNLNVHNQSRHKKCRSSTLIKKNIISNNQKNNKNKYYHPKYCRTTSDYTDKKDYQRKNLSVNIECDKTNHNFYKTNTNLENMYRINKYIYNDLFSNKNNDYLKNKKHKINNYTEIFNNNDRLSDELNKKMYNSNNINNLNFDSINSNNKDDKINNLNNLNFSYGENNEDIAFTSNNINKTNISYYNYCPTQSNQLLKHNKVNSFREKNPIQYSHIKNMKNTYIKKTNEYNNNNDNKIKEFMDMLGTNDYNETKEKLQKLILVENFAKNLAKIYKKENNNKKNINLNEILYWVSYISQYHGNNKEYEKFCRKIMEDYNINDFNEFKNFICNILENNKKNQCLIGDAKKIINAPLDNIGDSSEVNTITINNN